jgi:hypothetical protein
MTDEIKDIKKLPTLRTVSAVKATSVRQNNQGSILREVGSIIIRKQRKKGL